jgi:hypothetical protein
LGHRRACSRVPRATIYATRARCFSLRKSGVCAEQFRGRDFFEYTLRPVNGDPQCPAKDSFPSRSYPRCWSARPCLRRAEVGAVEAGAAAQEEEPAEARAQAVAGEQAAAARALRVVQGRRPRIRETRVAPREPASMPAEPIQTPIRVPTSPIPIPKTGWIRNAHRGPVERTVRVARMSLSLNIANRSSRSCTPVRPSRNRRSIHNPR